MALRTIRKIGDEVLRKVCKPVDQIDDRLLMLIDDMIETLHDTENGAAIAAPQVGILKRVVVIDMDELYILINPEIIETAGEQTVEEGCLSVPGKWGRLKRPDWVKVKALNEKGETITVIGEGDMAKCLCHEIDHLDGILYVDKAFEMFKAK